ncbi:MAG: IGHMBP2 family helicase [Candidatus Hadarchaeota archaeon]
MNSEIYIGGLPENSGPGDILGAIAGETDVSGDKIGRIDIKGSTALVSVSDDSVDEIVENLEKVGGESIFLCGGDGPNSHFLKLSRLVEIEREEEMRRHEMEIRNTSGREREGMGRAILHLRSSDEGTGLGGKALVKFSRQRKGEPLPDNEITVGDLVMISKNDPLRDDNPTGTVAEKTNYSLTVAFDLDPPGFVYGKGLRCDLYVNDITYQRQLEALEEVYTSENNRLNELARKSLGLENIEEPESGRGLDFLDEDLNESQKEAVNLSMASDDFFLVHGPPGTGKTVTCIEVARQLVREGNKVLCTADSNTAVDNLVEWLANWGEKVVRIGHPARVTPTLRNHTLDEIVQQNEKYQKSQELRNKAMDLVDKQEEFTHPGGRWRRGMSDHQIKSLAKKERGSRGVPPDKIQEMAEWLKLQDKINDLFNRIERLEEEAVEEILEWADLVCATNSGCGSDVLKDEEFDVVVIDEATQSTEPSCWIPITRADRAIMAGDHKQLPPTILSERAEELGRTLFESLLREHNGEISKTLEIQYRMHKRIMNFSNEEFYDGVLKAHESVANHTLRDLVDGYIDLEGISQRVLDPEVPVVYLDTSGIEAPERSRADSPSKENLKEAQIVESIVSEILEIGLDPKDIAVISPYDDQVDLINKKLDSEELEVDTVDGFQGREKEIIVLSLVRSNESGNIGFLEDVRRLNVSLTRAKRKLIIVADSSTINNHPTYSRMYEYVLENGRVIKGSSDRMV